jgi:hypothetical protein
MPETQEVEEAEEGEEEEEEKGGMEEQKKEGERTRWSLATYHGNKEEATYLAFVGDEIRRCQVVRRSTRGGGGKYYRKEVMGFLIWFLICMRFCCVCFYIYAAMCVFYCGLSTLVLPMMMIMIC